MRTGWINRTVWGIVVATFFSDVSHEMCTAVLPEFIRAVGFGPLALGVIDGVADFMVSLSKLGGGIVGHRVQRKKPWTAAGYVVTTLCTSAIGLTRSLVPMVVLRTIAWTGRGFRSPLRDYLLADAVEKTHYGRVFGLERAGDMLGAVVGPLFAALMVFCGVSFSTIILWGIVPGMLAAAAIFFVAQERVDSPPPLANAKGHAAAPSGERQSQFPRQYWMILIGVLIFGLGDFSRTFLIYLAAAAFGTPTSGDAAGSLVRLSAVPMLLYAMHNAVSAIAAFPSGHLGDRRAKFPVLVAGYALGVLTNLLLIFGSGSAVWLVVIFILSGTYIAVEETLEKAVVADLLPREIRSLGLGTLACGNAVGDMASSVYVGALLQAGHPRWAFGIAAAFGAIGVAWMLWLLTRQTLSPATISK